MATNQDERDVWETLAAVALGLQSQPHVENSTSKKKKPQPKAKPRAKPTKKRAA